MKRKLFVNKSIRRALGIILITALLFACVCNPLSVLAADSDIPYELISNLKYEFNEDGIIAEQMQGPYIDGGHSTDWANDAQEMYEKRVAGWSIYGLEDDPEEEGDKIFTAYNDFHETMGLGSAYRLHRNSTFGFLQAAKGYAITIRYRAVSNHNDGSATTHYSYLQLGYGSTINNTKKDDTYRNMGPETVSKVVATMARTTSGSDTYTATDENNVSDTREFGTWYTETYYFKTPEVFPTDEFLGKQSQHLILFARCYYGAKFEIDYVDISEVSVIQANFMGGKADKALYSGTEGQPIALVEPTRDGYDFDGWYTDPAYTEGTEFTATTYESNSMALDIYAKWKNSYNTQMADFYAYPDGILTDATNKGGAGGYFSFTTPDAYGTRYLRYRNSSGTIDADNPAYIILADENGPIKLKPNTDYSISYDYTMGTVNGKAANATISFFTASETDATDGAFIVPGSNTNLSYAWQYTDKYLHIRTGEIEEGKDTLYFRIVSKDDILFSLSVTHFKVTEVDSNSGFYYAKDTLSDKTYELVGAVGEQVVFPEISHTVFYEPDAWFTDETFTTKHDGTFAQGVNYLYLRWKSYPLDFEDYFHNDSINQVHTFGEDCEIVDSGDAEHGKVLSYDFAYTPNYYKATSNAVSLAIVNDGVTYKLTYDYKLDSAKGDVEIEFFTAHRNARWTFLNNYDKSAYTVRQSEAGDGWKTATVYFTADLDCGGETYDDAGDGLFICFKPTVLDETKLSVDNILIEPVEADQGVVVFLDKDENVFSAVSGNVGETVSAPESSPVAYLSSFNGWYTDAAASTAFTSATIASGITYVYSAWEDGVEDFEGNLYENPDIKDGVFAPESDSTLKLGKVENNTTYLITYDYTANGGEKLYFKTASGENANVNVTEYVDEGSVTELTASSEYTQGKALITTAFTYTISKESDINARENDTAVYGDYLYAVLEGGATLDNIKITAVEALTGRGSAVVIDEVSNAAGEQALRFLFGYKSQNSAVINIGGEDYSLIERGIVIKNAVNTMTGKTDADGNTIVEAVTLDKAIKEEKGYAYKGKTYGFNSYWEYDTENGEIVFSSYIKGLTLNDSRLTAARGYIKVKDAGGNVYTLYSGEAKTSVKDTKDLLAEYTEVDTHTINGVSWNRFSIVNPKIMSYIYGQQIENLIDYAKEKGVYLYRFIDNQDEKTYEIVIGDTSRDISDEVSVSGENNYIIKVIGTKVVIKGGSDIATMQAVADLIELFKRKDELGCGANLYDGFVMTGSYTASSDKYALAFGDEFDGTSSSEIDSVWNGASSDGDSYEASAIDGRYVTGRGPGGSPVKLANSGETKELVTLRDGSLVLGTAYIEPTLEEDIENSASFVDSSISTTGNMIYQYGMLEFKVKLAKTPCTTSLWVNGEVGKSAGIYRRGCFTEYDMLENFGNNTYYSSNIHYWWDENKSGDESHIDTVTEKIMTNNRVNYYPEENETNMADTYHIFTLIWTDEGVSFAFDGVKYCTYASPDWYKEAMPNYIILSAGLGDASYGVKYDVTKHDEYFETLVDYVRLYQIKDMGSFIYDIRTDEKY